MKFQRACEKIKDAKLNSQNCNSNPNSLTLMRHLLLMRPSLITKEKTHSNN
jgi:hypothetical protein